MDKQTYIRGELEAVKAARERINAEAAKARADLAHWLREAQDAGLSMSEAARLAGVSRVSAYEFLKGP